MQKYESKLNKNSVHMAIKYSEYSEDEECMKVNYVCIYYLYKVLPIKKELAFSSTSQSITYVNIHLRQTFLFVNMIMSTHL